MDLVDPNHVPISLPKVEYNFELANEICDWYQSGLSLIAISKMDHMPSVPQLSHWLKTIPEFSKLFEQTKVTRALLMESMAQDVIEGIRHKDDVPGARAKADMYSKQAEWNDPSTYGKKATISGDAGKPILFRINTGFPDLLPHQRQPEIAADGLIKKIQEEAVQTVSEAVILQKEEEES